MGVGLVWWQCHSGMKSTTLEDLALWSTRALGILALERPWHYFAVSARKPFQSVRDSQVLVAHVLKYHLARRGAGSEVVLEFPLVLVDLRDIFVELFYSFCIAGRDVVGV